MVGLIARRLTMADHIENGRDTMHFEINVSLDGQHYFATAERSLTDEATALQMLAHFAQVFPPEEGYRLTLTQKFRTGRDVAELDADSPVDHWIALYPSALPGAGGWFVEAVLNGVEQTSKPFTTHAGAEAYARKLAGRFRADVHELPNAEAFAEMFES